MLLISTHIYDSFWKLRLFRKWDKGMDINPEDETSYTTQYQEAFLKCVENEYWAKHRLSPVTIPKSVPTNNLVFSAMASRSAESAYDPYDLSSDDEEYLMLENLAKTTPWQSGHAARLMTAARLYLYSPPELPQNWGQNNTNLNDYHSNPMEISSTLWLPDIADWWHREGETHLKYADLSNVGCDIFSIIPHSVGVEARVSLGRDVVGWRQWKPTGKTLHDKGVLRQFAWDINGLLAGDDPALDTTNTETYMEMKREAEQRKLHQMAKVHNFLEIRQGRQNLQAKQKESCAQNK